MAQKTYMNQNQKKNLLFIKIKRRSIQCLRALDTVAKKKGECIGKQIPKIDLNLINKKETKMSKVKMQNRIKKMNFQKQERRVLDELSDNDKYIIELAGYKKDTLRSSYENLPKFARGTTRPQHI